MILMQLLEAAWCLTNIAAGEPEETKSLLPALPLLIAHLGG
jgi:importin subunit alpha-1